MNIILNTTLLFLLIFTTSCQSSKPSEHKVYKVKVDQTGYHPSNIEVPSGAESVILSFKRTTDHTCAKEVVSEEQSINKKLPLNKEVNIEFKLKDLDTVTFGCHMGKMHKGEISKKDSN